MTKGGSVKASCRQKNLDAKKKKGKERDREMKGKEKGRGPNRLVTERGEQNENLELWGGQWWGGGGKNGEAFSVLWGVWGVLGS